MSDEPSIEALKRLPNLGVTIARRLVDAGITSPEALSRAGAVDAYVAMQRRAPTRLPHCYYLYAIDGALRGQDWRTLTEKRKRWLQRQAELQLSST